MEIVNPDMLWCFFTKEQKIDYIKNIKTLKEFYRILHLIFFNTDSFNNSDVNEICDTYIECWNNKSDKYDNDDQSNISINEAIFEYSQIVLK